MGIEMTDELFIRILEAMCPEEACINDASRKKNFQLQLPNNVTLMYAEYFYTELSVIPLTSPPAHIYVCLGV